MTSGSDGPGGFGQEAPDQVGAAGGRGGWASIRARLAPESRAGRDGEEAEAPGEDGRGLGDGLRVHVLGERRRADGGVRPLEGLIDRLGGGGAERGHRIAHHRPSSVGRVDIVARLVELLGHAESEHQLVGDIVGEDLLELPDARRDLRFLIDEAEPAPPQVGRADRCRERDAGGAGDHAEGMGRRDVRVGGQVDRDTALRERLLGELKHRAGERGLLLGVGCAAEEGGDLRAVVPRLGVAARNRTGGGYGPDPEIDEAVGDLSLRLRLRGRRHQRGHGLRGRRHRRARPEGPPSPGGAHRLRGRGHRGVREESGSPGRGRIPGSRPTRVADPPTPAARRRHGIGSGRLTACQTEDQVRLKVSLR